ncbi:MAG: hypothetical protein EPO09_18730 [Aquabacterium sp.]|uniref:hypothetical protein n=1 Tax=Aquabacterium sp. TaxID=1872578 RepID=UPI0012266A87|nr:hypothetical protein [Aquabacterium sp.]TAK87540.1 MAG: hypothetical protein EPO09_18730 [Aquabacterium sp.]
MKRCRTWLLIFTLFSMMLAACTSTPPVDQSAAHSPAVDAFEQRTLANAQSQMQQEHLAEAVLSWEALSLLRPGHPMYAQQLKQARDLVAQKVAEQLPAARQARQRGALDEASQRYLSILALQPDNTGAAQALRDIEQQRNKQLYLGRYSRLTLAKAASSKQMAQGKQAANTTLAAERNALEHAALLAGQGEFDDAITLLQQELVARPKDGATIALLADVYYRQATSLEARDKPAAVAALRQCLRLAPAHTEARRKLAQLTSKP